MIIYTDGSCSINPGPGGWAMLVLDNNYNYINCAFARHSFTTNNRMELMAILYAMGQYGKEEEPPTVYSDSAYCVNMFTSWIYTWKENGWKTSRNKEPENFDLIQTYLELEEKGYKINLQKVKGHSDDIYNNLVDLLATGKCTEKEVKEFFERHR